MTNGMNKIAIFKEEGDMSSTDNANCYSEDDLPEEVHSPTDSSEDSVEVKVSPISGRNKRKCAEPRKVHDPIFRGPLKKRMCLQARAESEELKKQEQQQHRHQQQQQQQQPFRPWSKEQQTKAAVTRDTDAIRESNGVISNKFTVPSAYHRQTSHGHHVFACPQPIVSFYVPPSPSNGFFRPPSPIKPSVDDDDDDDDTASSQPVSLVIKRETSDEPLRVPLHPQATASSSDCDALIKKSSDAFPKLQSSSSSSTSKQHQQRKEQRNYKNMTRERRIEANARERTRVHTISAAFDTLRRAIPAYSHSQKLSKLSVLRIACSYIMTLSDLVQEDDGNAASIREGVEAVSRTIQREGKLRKKKEDE